MFQLVQAETHNRKNSARASRMALNERFSTN